MTTTPILTATAQSIHLRNYETTDSIDQYIIRLRQAIASAVRRNDTAQLAELRIKFEQLKEMYND